MPRPQGKKPNVWKKQQYSNSNTTDDIHNHNHNDYHNSQFNTRRVSFKPNVRNHDKQSTRGATRNWGSSLQAHLIEEDIDMGGMGDGAFNVRNRFMNRQRRDNTPRPRNVGVEKRKLFEGIMGWYRVTLPYGGKYDKDFMKQLLAEKVEPLTFIPIMWRATGASLTFYLDEFKVAERLDKLDRNIDLPDGFKLIIRIGSGFPNVELTMDIKDKIKLAMGKRYNAEHKALDLTRFHVDPELQDVFCALFKPLTMLTAVDVIAENIPDLEALKLDSNKLQNFVHMKRFATKLPNVKILHLKDNKFRDLSTFDSISGLPLVELVLEGNPLCAKYKDQAAYVSDVRKRFPKVIRLDGIDLPPPISFDIQDDHKLPPPMRNFLCAEEGKAIVGQFLEQYYLIMDSDSRQPLLNAYHDTAMFSMTMAYPYGQSAKTSAFLTWYQTESRNLQRVTDGERRWKLLKQGNLQIVSFLTDMPAMKHDVMSFTCDLTFFTAQMLLLTVTGIFKELRSGHKTPPIRFFCRTMAIVPAGSGFCIINDVLHITNATEAQAKVAFQTPRVEATTSSPVPVAVAPSLDDNAKQALVLQFANDSKMNLEWSQRCLEETLWDFHKAAEAFVAAQNKGVIPPEAFVK